MDGSILAGKELQYPSRNVFIVEESAMRMILLVCTCILAGCAGQPTKPAATTVVKASQQAPLKADGTVDKDALVNARKLGYTVKNENGETLYCRTENKMGSRVEKETVCLTAQQIDELREQTQRSLGNIMREIPPPQGK